MQLRKITPNILLAFAACSTVALAACSTMAPSQGATPAEPRYTPQIAVAIPAEDGDVVSDAAEPSDRLLGPALPETEPVPEPNATNVAMHNNGAAEAAADFVATSDVTADVTAEESSGTPGYADLWDRIRTGFGLPKIDDTRVTYHEQWFAKNPNYLERKVERARLYLYYIVEEVEKRRMPMEIALLPAIESAYQPHAYSRARALGLWQFIAPTARLYGIKMDWWYDGRQDVLASTNAALDYLQKLYEEFGDWHLALASYNAGEGRVRYAIYYNLRKGRPTDYQHLQLRAETRHYVPKLIAFANIVADPQAYGVELTPIPNEPYFVPVDVGSQIDLNIVAELADVPIGDLYDINPGFKRWATAPDGPHRVLVPIDKKEQLIEGLNSLPEQSRVRWHHHRVQRGETLSTIAQRYRVSVWQIQKANHLRGTLIRAGQDLMIPVSARPLSRQVANVTRPVTPRSYVPTKAQAKVVHHVRQGETLWSIARRYQVYVSQLTSWNLIRPQDILRVGQRLNIWISPSLR